MVMILSMSSALLTLKADKSFTYTPTSGLSFTYKGHAENQVKLFSETTNSNNNLLLIRCGFYCLQKSLKEEKSS